MAQSLEEAAKTGDINGLYDSIKEDPNVLDRIDAIPFVHTPLHIAVSAGHTDFTIEILRLLPSLGRKLNPKGESSLHLALINKKFDMVKRLIKFDKEIIRVKGREGITPLHFIAQKDINGDQQRTDDSINTEQQQIEEDPRLNILAEFLFTCPDSIEDLTNRNETVLHIAVKTKNQGAVEVILGCIRRMNKKRVLANKDQEGNTALHIAVSHTQLEMVKLLVTGFLAYTNETNSEGRTARDIALSLGTDEAAINIRSSLSGAGALESSPPHYSLARFLNSYEQPLDMNVALTVAAEKGDINGLYGLIERAPRVLDDIDGIPFVDTPLHTAASVGHTDFAIEILRLKPSFGRKLNPDGLSSLHLALINDKFETVKRLVKFDKDLIQVKGREGANSLHLIAKRDNKSDQQQIVASRIDILAEFLFACPNSIDDLTIRDETPLHIAVKSNNQKAVAVILGCIRRIKGKRVLDYKDKEGKTALCMAMASSQIAHSLHSAGASKSSSPDPNLAEFLNSQDQYLEVLFKFKFCLDRAVSMDLRNIVLVVAALIATATFTAVLSPPGGIGGPGDNSLFTNGSYINATVSSTTNNLFAANTSFINANLLVPSEDPVKRLLFNGGGAKAGFATRVFLGDGTYGSIFSTFYCLNTVAFVLSMLTIMFVLPVEPFFYIMHLALYFLMSSYGFSFPLISPSDVYSLYFLVPSTVCAVLIFAARSVIFASLMVKRNKRFQILQRLMMNSVGQ